MRERLAPTTLILLAALCLGSAPVRAQLLQHAIVNGRHIQPRRWPEGYPPEAVRRQHEDAMQRKNGLIKNPSREEDR